MEQFALPGETAGDFMRQYKALTDKDKADLYAWFNEAGLPTELPAGPAKAA